MWWKWLFVLTSIGGVVWSQEHRAAPVQLRGSLSATAEAYTNSGDAPVQRFLPRYGARLFFRPVVQLFGQVELPFELTLSTQSEVRAGYPVGFQQPFNQFGLSPRITSWLRLHGGYFSLSLSELSFGEPRILGGGVELSPGIFRLKAFYGVVQQPRALDTASGFPGAYRRWAWGASIGFSTDGGTELVLNYVRLLDDTTSIHLRRVVRDSLRADTIVTPAQDNAVAALSFRAPLGSVLSLQGEVALSAFSSSLQAAEKELGVPRWIFVPRYSSNLDGAARIVLTLTPSQTVSVSLGGRWIGPGFSTLGYPWLANDVAEVTVAPTLTLAENTISLRLSGGLQWNNLRRTRLGTTRRLIGSAGLSWQPSSAFGVDLQYTNYGTRMQHEVDSFRVQNIYQSLALAPRWQFVGLGGTNMLMASYSFSNTDDQNPITSTATRQTTHSLLLFHSLLLPSALSFTTTSSHTRTTAQLETRLWMFSETVSFPILPQLTGSVAVSWSRMYTLEWDTQWSTRLSFTYQLQRWGALTWSSFLNRSERAGRRPFLELHSSLTYGLSF